MESIPRTYIVDENDRKIAVRLDIEIFEKIESVLEDYALEQLVMKNDEKELFDLIEAESFYSTVEKSK